MVFGLPAIGETSWGQKILDSINAVKATADAAQPAATLDAAVAGDVADSGSNTRAALAKALVPVTNVREFGAVGDGVTNDTAAVQAAITYALTATNPANGEVPPHTGVSPTVFFPLGTYKVGELQIPGTVRLLGEGGGTYANATLLQSADGQSIVRLKADTDGSSNSTVFENLTFKSASATSSATVAQVITDTGIASNSVYFHNCWFKTPETYAIWMTQGDDIKIDHCTFDVAAYHAIRFGSGAGNVVSNAEVSNCTFYDVAATHIMLDNVSGVCIDGNRMNGNNNTTAIFIDAPSTGATAIATVTVTGNQANSLGGFAKVPTLAGGVTISGNAIRDASEYVVALAGGGVLYGFVFTGNVVYNPGPSTYSPIIGTGCGLQGSIISGNSFINAGVAQALVIEDNDARVIDNHLAGNAKVGFTAFHNLATPASNGY